MSAPGINLEDDQPVRLLRKLRDRFVLIYVCALLIALAFAPRFGNLTHEQLEVDVPPHAALGTPSSTAGSRPLPLPPLSHELTFPQLPSFILDEEPLHEAIEQFEPTASPPRLGDDLDATAALLLSPQFDLFASDATAGFADTDLALFDQSAHSLMPAYLTLGSFGSSSGSGGGAGGSGGSGVGANSFTSTPPSTRGPAGPDAPSNPSDPGSNSDNGNNPGGGANTTYQTSSQIVPGDDGSPGDNGGGTPTNPPVSVPEPGTMFLAGLGAAAVAIRFRLRRN